MANHEDLAFPFRVADLPLLALAIQNVPRPLWGDVAVGRLRGMPGFTGQHLDARTLEGVYKKLLDHAPELLGKTAELGSVLTDYEKYLEAGTPVQSCIFCVEGTPLTPTDKSLEYVE